MPCSTGRRPARRDIPAGRRPAAAAAPGVPGGAVRGSAGGGQPRGRVRGEAVTGGKSHRCGVPGPGACAARAVSAGAASGARFPSARPVRRLPPLSARRAG
ncbi:hypothetical protein [Streptomyces sp. NPDC088847]|uniref:hypothetical protein n=1 Tax=Streptomyces sp. NPDC088847 TaxID=3365909 RepID=UPI00380CF311